MTDDGEVGQAFVDELIGVLELKSTGPDTFIGYPPERPPLRHLFGGQVAAQALMAAGSTVPPERSVHSLHAYFIRPGDPSRPVDYAVERVRDGRSFTTRRVTATQSERVLLTFESSFQVPDPDTTDRQVPMPAVELPLSSADTDDVFARPGRPNRFAFEFRRILLADQPRDQPPGVRASRIWMNARGRMPDDPLLHAAALTYASDLLPVRVLVELHEIDHSSGRLRMVSLDHAMWFHRPCRADEWLLHQALAPTLSSGRGLVSTQIFAADGRLVASIVQEGLLQVD